MRGSGTKQHPAIHMASAFASKQRLTLGQLAVEEKSNEITAIPALLDLIDLKNGVVTIDAMGCQTAIAEKIIGKEADYILAVKDNQMELNQQVIKVFEMNKGTEISDTFDFGHGRIETRSAAVITDLTFLDTKDKWAGLKSIIKLDTHRIHKSTGKEETETRYYISSSEMSFAKFNSAIRNHWAIENNLHWCLDVVFKEDSSKRRKGNSAVNFNLVAKIALKLIEKTDVALTKPKKREAACLNDSFRELVLGLF
jgi:predicted transposase YbfD/YdcC